MPVVLTRLTLLLSFIFFSIILFPLFSRQNIPNQFLVLHGSIENVSFYSVKPSREKEFTMYELRIKHLESSETY